MAGPELLTATAPDGARLAAAVHGTAGPLVLMIPGLGATRHVYDPVLPALVGRGLRCAVMDNRGVGESDVTDGPYTMVQLAADAVSVLDALGVDRAHIFGASMGGFIAQWVAIGHPDRVERLVLACTGPGRTNAVKAKPEATAKLLGKGATTPAGAYRIACEVLYAPEFAAAHPEFIEAQVAERARHPVAARAFQGQQAASWGHDAWERLPEIAAPTLVIHGTADVVMPPGNAERLADRIPGSRLVLLEGLGHLLFHEEPDEFGAIVAPFLLGAEDDQEI